MHSHIAGVDPAMRARNIGFALKLHQRAWALVRGISEICWTFDPLVRRNAYFNLVKLAADATEYLPNFYGPMDDAINGGDETDRLLVRWQLDSPAVSAACEGRLRSRSPGVEAVDALKAGADGGPLMGLVSGATIRIAIPADIESLRRTDPKLAAEWRLAVRDVLGGNLGDGGRIAGFDRNGWYLMDRKDMQ
ncbi:hypothetical protein ACSMXN_21970 [Jatrophihabitans sp. DSM 45814]